MIKFWDDQGRTTAAKTSYLAMIYWCLNEGIAKNANYNMFTSLETLSEVFLNIANQFGALPDDLQMEGIRCLDIAFWGSSAIKIAAIEESYCSKLLLWLANYGNILHLEIDGKYIRRDRIKKYRSIDDI